MRTAPRHPRSRLLAGALLLSGLAAVAPSSSAAAQERPSEGALFGAPGLPPTAAEPEAPSALEPEPGAERRLLAALVRAGDPLQLGGLLYLRSSASAREGVPPSRWSFSAPSLTDLYLDARPSERVRAFVLGRMLFDPLQGSAGSLVPGVALPGASGAAPANPRVLLDQLWLRFDAGRRAFFTVGRQHVKWGVGRFWNPTDYLHAVRRDPLAPFDDRTGTFLARVELPWERLGWSFQGVAILEPLLVQASSPFASSGSGGVGQVGGAAVAAAAGNELGEVGAGGRADLLLGPFAVGLDAVVQRGLDPRFGVDVSGPLGDVDAHAELALRAGSDVPLYRGQLTAGGLPAFERYEPEGVRPSLVLGGEWSHKYSDEDTFTVGAEYFYQANGYGGPELYPLLLAAGAFTPFYLGRHYAGAYLVLPRPGAWDLHTFTLSAIANLSDRSALVRLDWAVTLLTYLQLEAFAQAHLGRAGGELRLGLDLPANLGGLATPAVKLGAPVADAGIALRVSL